MHCAECDAVFFRRASKVGKKLCVRCASMRTVAAAIQLNRHRGPYWDKWLDSMAGAVARLTAENIDARMRDGEDLHVR